MNKNEITLTQGYEALLHFLNDFYERSGSNDLTDILSGGEYLSDGKPADSAFWEDWLEAVEKVQMENRHSPKHSSDEFSLYLLKCVARNCCGSRFQTTI